MKKNRSILILALLLISGLVLYLLLKRNETKDTIGGADTAFAVADTAAVTRIFMSTKGSQNVLLERKGEDKWTVNKKYEAFQPNVNVLLKTLAQMEVKRPVARQARANVIKEIATQGIKVEVYTRQGLLKTFYVGNPTASSTGTNVIMEGAEQPYVVALPGFEGYITGRFNNPESEWRSRAVFRSVPASIQQLTVTYPDTPRYSFEIRHTAGKPELVGHEGASPKALRDYLGQYGKIYAEQIMDDMPERFRDSLQLIKPWAVIRLQDADPRKSNEITIYPPGAMGARMVAVYGADKTLATVQGYVFNKLLVTPYAFLPQPAGAEKPKHPAAKPKK